MRPIALLALAWALIACAPVRPWQRAKLAHWSMQAGEIVGPGEAHVRAIHEGATGGGATAESGCGCN